MIFHVIALINDLIVFAVGEKVDAKITSIDKNSRKVSLSIKALEIEEEKKALSEYGSSDSGASLGDILGAAMSKAKTDTKVEAEEEKKLAKKADEAEATKEPAKKKATTKKAKEEEK